MSRLIAAVFLVIGLVIVAHVKDPERPARCCADPGHRMPTEHGEMTYCPSAAGDRPPTASPVRSRLSSAPVIRPNASEQRCGA